MNPETYLYLVIIGILILFLITYIRSTKKDDKISNLSQKYIYMEETLNKALLDKSDKINILEDTASELKKELRARNKDIKAREKEIQELSQTVKAQSEKIAELEERIHILSNIEEVSTQLNDSDEIVAEVTLDMLGRQQRAVFELMSNSDKNLLITGEAGTGKSAVLKVFCKETKSPILRLAPTGLAAINIGGVTIHSAFGYDNFEKRTLEEILSGKIKLSDNQRLLLQKSKSIIIDEISMVSSETLQKIDAILKFVNGNDRLFGGKQMLFFGDLFQLPPIVKTGKKTFMIKTFGGIHFFDSWSYKEGGFKFIELTENFKASRDPSFLAILNDIRVGKISKKQLEELNTRLKFDPSELQSVPRLYPKKEQVNEYNEAKLKEIKGSEFVSKAQVEFLAPGAAIPATVSFVDELRLKKGALVMMNKNGDNWVNGTLGLVSEIKPGALIVAINGINYEVWPEKFEEYEAVWDEKTETITYKKVYEVVQYPVVLAYAMTIHKAQGQTYGKIAVDVSECFDAGHAYVALSRVRELKGLYLLEGVKKSSIKTDPTVIDFYKENKASEESAV